MLEIGYDVTEGPVMVIFSSQGKVSQEKKLYEWEASTSGISRIFIADTEDLWFQKHIDRIYRFLSLVPDKTLMLGCSRGGYAALLFAHMFWCRSLTFSPQTSLHDDRWPSIKDARRLGSGKPEYHDLSFISGQQHTIYYCSEDLRDKEHAERLDVIKKPLDCDKHVSAVVLKHRGQLKTILEDHWLRSLTA